MKFFRQTKETKRKISFFMALAMVISLLPVSPVAKAADDTKQHKLTVYSTVSDAAIQSVDAGATGSAVVTLKSSEEGKVITNASITAKIVTSETSTNGAVSKEGEITVVSGPSVKQDQITANHVVKDGVCKVTISNITTASAIILSGSVTLDDEATSESTPTPKPTPGGDATPTPKPTYEVTVVNSVGENIILSVNGKVIPKQGDSFSIEDGKKIPVEIEPAESYVWDTTSTVKAGNKDIKLTDLGGKYSADVLINEKTTIVASGGSVMSIDTVKGNLATPAPATGSIDNAEIAFNDPKVQDSIVDTIIKNIQANNNGVSTSAIITALASGPAITTSYKISETTSEGAIKKITDSFSSLQETLGDIDSETFNNAIKEGYAVDINIEVTYTYNGQSNSIGITVLGKEVSVTIPVPESLKDKESDKGDYYAFRIHDGEVTAIKCTRDGDKLTFKSDKFSTYVISFVEKETTTPTSEPTSEPTGEPTKKPDNNGGGGGIGVYNPSSPTGTPVPSATAAPSAKPSAKPDNTTTPAPGADNTAAPSESGAPSTGDNTTPTKAPTATNKPNDTDKDDTGSTGSTAVKVGKKATVSGSQYKVTAVKGTRTVQFTKGKKNAKNIVVPSTVKISGKNYKVTTIAKNAFKGNKKLTKVTIGKNVNKIGANAFKNCSKLKSIVIKSTKLTAKKVGKNAFKGINKKATFKVPKSKVKAYKKIVKAKGAGKNVKVKK